MSRDLSGSGEQIKEKEIQRESLFAEVERTRARISQLGTTPKVSGELSNLLKQKSRNEQLVAQSLQLAGRLGGVFGGTGASIRQRVSEGFFVSSTRSRLRRIKGPGGKIIGSRSTFSVSFSKLTQGLPELIQKQQELDLRRFEVEKDILQSQVVSAQSSLDLFERRNRTARDLLTRGQAGVARLKKKRGRLSLRTRGSRTGLLEDSTTTQSLLN